ncbi:hypothetical protein NLJ89_g4847 [Agrocybe chaxingu]|uniref:CCHC-type domain-containing protein n=1 Tax=Agrocybe chaxingu TaxID=84603 RepID=A0A9W8K1Z6_9AGAR|nr:hypothetical protein NLJ89_g4847 [Agrocybe chaxingu]
MLLKMTDIVLKPACSSEKTDYILFDIVPPILVKIENGNLFIRDVSAALKYGPNDSPIIELPLDTVRCALCIRSEDDVFMGYIELGEELVIFRKEPELKRRFDLEAKMANGLVPSMILFTMASGIKERNSQDHTLAKNPKNDDGRQQNLSVFFFGDDEEMWGADLLNICGDTFYERIANGNAKENLDSCLRSYDLAWHMLPPDAPEHPAYQFDAALAYYNRFQLFEKLSDIDHALSLFQAVVDATPDEDRRLPFRVRTQGLAWDARFERSQSLTDLSNSISSQRRVVQLCPENDADLPALLNNFGVALEMHFDKSGNLADLSEAISSLQRAIALAPSGQGDLPSMVGNLGLFLQKRFQQAGAAIDLLTAISSFREALNLTPAGDAGERRRWQSSLATALRLRYEDGRDAGELSYLSESIEILQQVIKETPTGDDDLPTRFDLSKAVEFFQKALDLTPDGDSILPSRLTNLGEALHQRFDREGKQDDLSKALSLHRHAIQIATQTHPTDLHIYFTNLGVALKSEFLRSGDMGKLSEAVSSFRKAITVTPPNHPDLSSRLNNLGEMLRTRYGRSGVLQDLSEAISTLEEATANPTDPAAKSDVGTFFNNLALAYLSRFQLLEDPVDLSKAISSENTSIKLTPAEHQRLPVLLNNLESISSLKRAVDLTRNLPDLPGWMNNLALAYRRRFEHAGNLQDLNEAIQIHGRVINLTPENHPSLSRWYNSLGIARQALLARTNDSTLITTVLSHYRQAATLVTGIPSDRIRSARRWAEFSMQHDQSQVLESYGVAIDLLSEYAGMGKTLESRHASLANVADLASAAATAAISKGKDQLALEWLEHGRCVVWTQLNQLRTPLDALSAKHPEIAERFQRASIALDQAGTREIDPTSISESMEKKVSLEEEAINHMKRADEYNHLLKEIRHLPGFSDFLRPRKASEMFSRLPKNGAVVLINVHEEKCYAMILVNQPEIRLVTIPLKHVSRKWAVDLRSRLMVCLSSRSVTRDSEIDRDSVIDRAGHPMRASPQKIHSILRTLWVDLVKPILDAIIGCHAPTKYPFRLWWCATGPLAFLPLHAAGIYEEGGASVSDYAISSYVPNISTLINKDNTTEATPRMLLISQSTAEHMAHIPGADSETEIIFDLGRKHDLEAFRLSGEDATVNEVQERMPMYRWVHLACHATQYPLRPLKSAFHLLDGELDISEIIKLKIPDADFAFLSACQTSTGDQELSNEAVHLAAGMLAAGYRSVVSTMWSIKDSYGPEVAELFYSHFLEGAGEDRKVWPNGTSAAHALHRAVQSLRKKLGDTDVSLLTWVPFFLSSVDEDLRVGELVSELGGREAFAVCRNWRNVARSTPQLWSSIVINANHDDMAYAEFIKEWFRRSGDLPLSIKLRRTYTSHDRLGHDVTASQTAILDTVNHHSPRWESLDLSVATHPDPPHMWKSIYDVDIADPAAYIVRKPIAHLDVLFDLKSIRPSPTNVYLDGVTVEAVNISWHRLTHGHLRSTAVDYVELLRNSPAMTHLVLEDMVYYPAERDAPLHPMKHCSLQSLNIASSNGTEFFLDRIMLPSLGDLSIEDHSAGLTAVTDLITRSECPLKCLSAVVREETPNVEHRVIYLLEHTPALVELTLRCLTHTVAETLFRRPGPSGVVDNGPSGEFLPLLHTMTIGTRMKFSWASVVEMLETLPGTFSSPRSALKQFNVPTVTPTPSLDDSSNSIGFPQFLCIDPMTSEAPSEEAAIAQDSPPAAGSGPSNGPGRSASKKRRIPGACDICKRKKSASPPILSFLRDGPDRQKSHAEFEWPGNSGEMPDNKCTNCLQFGYECTHKEVTKTLGSAKSYVESLEARLEKMDQLLSKLLPGINVTEEVDRLTAKEEAEPEVLPRNDDDHLEMMLTLQLSRLKLNPPVNRFFGKSSSMQLVLTALNLKQEYTGVPLKPPRRESVKRSEFWSLPPITHSPPEDLIPSLVDAYFVEFNYFLPLLHRPTFEKDVAEKLHLTNHMFAATLLLVSEGSDNWRSSGWKWYEQVKVMRRSLFHRTTLYELQMLALHVMFAQASETPQGIWAEIGFALRLTQEVGAHRKRNKATEPNAEDELWKRAFWVIMCLDRHVSSSSGRACGLHDEDFDLEMPIECDDEYWDAGFEQPEGKPSSISFFNNYIRLMDILEYAMRTIYSIKRPGTALGNTPQRSEQQVIAELDSAMNGWMDAVPNHLRWSPNRENPTFLKQSAALHATYYYLQIFIHRPFIPSPRNPAPIAFPSLAICTNAARSCCHVLEAYHKIAALHSAALQKTLFTAAVILLLNIWSGKRSGYAPNPKREMEDVQKCMQIFKDLETRWASAGRLWDILRELAFAGDVSILNHPAPPPAPVRNKRPREADESECSTPTSSSADSPPPSATDQPRSVAGRRRVSMSPTSSMNGRRAASEVRPNVSPLVPHKTEAAPSPTPLNFSLPMYSNELGRLPIYGQFNFLDPGGSPNPSPLNPAARPMPMGPFGGFSGVNPLSAAAAGTGGPQPYTFDPFVLSSLPGVLPSPATNTAGNSQSTLHPYVMDALFNGRTIQSLGLMNQMNSLLQGIPPDTTTNPPLSSMTPADFAALLANSGGPFGGGGAAGGPSDVGGTPAEAETESMPADPMSSRFGTMSAMDIDTMTMWSTAPTSLELDDWSSYISSVEQMTQGFSLSLKFAILSLIPTHLRANPSLSVLIKYPARWRSKTVSMTRITNFGRKRTYLQAEFAPDEPKPSTSSPTAISSHSRQQTYDENSHEALKDSSTLPPPKKKRKRTPKSKRDGYAAQKAAEAAAAAGDGGSAVADPSINMDAGPSDMLEEPKKSSKSAKKKIREKKRKEKFVSASQSRRLKRINEKLENTTCFACREKGHAAKDCPSKSGEGGAEGGKTGVVGICYRCGSKKHSLSKCKKPNNPEDPYPYASCFVCNGKGHLASACPQNKAKGVYPNGGCCKLCGDTSHLARDCTIRTKVVDPATLVGTGREGGADEDDFHVMRRTTAELDRGENHEDKVKRVLSVQTGVLSGKPVALANSSPAKKKVVVFK